MAFDGIYQSESISGFPQDGPVAYRGGGASKSNEIKAILQLLELVGVRRAAVTINAMGYQCEVVANLMERRVDCIAAVKHNQPTLTVETLSCYEPKGLSQGRRL